MLKIVFNPALDEKKILGNNIYHTIWWLVTGAFASKLQPQSSVLFRNFCPSLNMRAECEKNEFCFGPEPIEGCQNSKVSHMFEKYVMDLHMIQFISIVEKVFEKQPI